MSLFLSSSTIYPSLSLSSTFTLVCLSLPLPYMCVSHCPTTICACFSLSLSTIICVSLSPSLHYYSCIFISLFTQAYDCFSLCFYSFVFLYLSLPPFISFPLFTCFVSVLSCLSFTPTHYRKTYKALKTE